MTLKLSDWASVAEILSSIAVVITLIVLIAEVSGNTDATLAATRQSLASRAEALLMQQAEVADLAEILEKAERDASLSPVETLRYGGFLGARVRNAEEAFLQFHAGQLDENYFRTRGAVVINAINNVHAREIWSRWKERGLFTPEFTAWVDEGVGEMQER